jgi:hypothetical protein
MDQTVMSFAGTAARGSAIPSPVAGMTTYLEDTNDLQIYDGSAYASALGATLVGSSVFTAQTSVTLNNVFSANYDAYIVRISVTPSATCEFTYTFVNGGTPAPANYAWNGIHMYGAGTLIASTGNNAASLRIQNANASQQTSYTINIADPFLTRQTFIQQQSQSVASGNGASDSHFINGRLANTTSYEGFRFIVSAGNMTGTLRIYGLRNA